MNRKQNTSKFLEEIGRIKGPEIFLGVVRILKVPFLKEGGEAKDFVELLEEVMEKFEQESRQRRRELYQILREANKAADPLDTITEKSDQVEVEKPDERGGRINSNDDKEVDVNADRAQDT